MIATKSSLHCCEFATYNPAAPRQVKIYWSPFQYACWRKPKGEIHGGAWIRRSPWPALSLHLYTRSHVSAYWSIYCSFLSFDEISNLEIGDFVFEDTFRSVRYEAGPQSTSVHWNKSTFVRWSTREFCLHMFLERYDTVMPTLSKVAK